jgi:cell volume regulation protein A
LCWVSSQLLALCRRAAAGQAGAPAAGAFIVEAGVADAPRVYEIIFMVVAFSVIVQGGTVPALARRLKIPLRAIEPEPWSLGVRFQEEPEGLHRLVVAPGSAADGTSLGDLPLPEDAWVSLIIRSGRLVPVHAGTALQTGDEVLVLAPGTDTSTLSALFT